MAFIIGCMAGPILFYFDFASPYAYFAVDQAETIARAHARTLHWRPVLLWAVLKGQGLPSPMDPPAKRAYLLADMARSAAFHGVPYAGPSLPLSSHKAARLYYALERRDPKLARMFGGDVFAAFFTARADISDVDVLAQLAGQRGISEREARDAIEGEIGRRGLGEAVEEAIRAGVYGSPWFVVDGESFFGADRLPQIAWRLSGNGRTTS